MNISIGDVPTVENPAWGASVGIVETHFATFHEPFITESGGIIPAPWTLAYETYGELNADRSNAILVCHALSGNAHAAGRHSPYDAKAGWCEPFIGPGRALDTERYFVICSNILGGCGGSTGPSSLDREGHAWGSRFPVLTIADMVRAQALLIDYLAIEQLLAVFGGSLGGMQALQWAVSYGQRVRGVVALATTARSSAFTIALNAVGRQAILTDPHWNGGDYYAGPYPEIGLATARRIGHISYLSAEGMATKFDRQRHEATGPRWTHEPEFAVESYLDYQGRAFVQRFDANTYLLITRAMDYFDLSAYPQGLATAFEPSDTSFFVASWSSDLIYPPHESAQLVKALTAAERPVAYYAFDSDRGHDSFLLNEEQITPPLQDWLATLALNTSAASANPDAASAHQRG